MRSKGLRGLGISALFAGASGTGKTMAAEVLAGELRLDLYRIDLSAVVSKYIGETEKNLRRVFDAAEEGGAILLFDEADALFGKRSEVKDSHDRYANIEVSYLLQRMEAYRGLAILTTNMKNALDTAFLRRIRFIVQFPFPDAAQRLEIWRRIFPANTPTDGLDVSKLCSAERGGRPHPQHRAERRLPGRRRQRTGPHAPPAARRAQRVRQARKTADRIRDRRLDMTPRHSTPNAQPSIELHIEELVLHGLPLTRGQGPLVQNAVETELARLLTEQGLSRSSAGATPHLSAGSIQLTKDHQPAHLGQQIAQAIYGGLTPAAASPSQTRSREGASE